MGICFSEDGREERERSRPQQQRRNEPTRKHSHRRKSLGHSAALGGLYPEEAPSHGRRRRSAASEQRPEESQLELGSAGSRTPPRVHRRAVPNRDQGLFKPRRTPASSSDAGFERPGPVIDPFIGSEGLSDYEARVGVGNIDERASKIEFGSDFSVSSRAKRAHGSGDRHRGAGGAS